MLIIQAEIREERIVVFILVVRFCVKKIIGEFEMSDVRKEDLLTEIDTNNSTPRIFNTR